VGPAATIDEQVHRLALAVEPKRSGEGYFTRLAREMKGDERQVTIRVEKALPEIDERMPLPKLRRHSIETVDGIVAMARRYGSKEQSLILFNDEQVELVLNEEPERGDREILELRWETSEDWGRWAKMLTGEAFEHRALLKFLLLNQHNMEQVELIDRMRAVRATAQVILDSEIKVDREAFSVGFRVNSDDTIVNFPRKFTLRLPVLLDDVLDPEKWVKVDVRVEVQLPERPDGRIGFALIAPLLDQTYAKRIDAEIKNLRSACEGWTVVRGAHRAFDRPRIRGNA